MIDVALLVNDTHTNLAYMKKYSLHIWLFVFPLYMFIIVKSLLVILLSFLVSVEYLCTFVMEFTECVNRVCCFLFPSQHIIVSLLILKEISLPVIVEYFSTWGFSTIIYIIWKWLMSILLRPPILDSAISVLLWFCQSFFPHSLYLYFILEFETNVFNLNSSCPSKCCLDICVLAISLYDRLLSRMTCNQYLCTIEFPKASQCNCQFFHFFPHVDDELKKLLWVIHFTGVLNHEVE